MPCFFGTLMLTSHVIDILKCFAFQVKSTVRRSRSQLCWHPQCALPPAGCPLPAGCLLHHPCGDALHLEWGEGEQGMMSRKMCSRTLIGETNNEDYPLTATLYSITVNIFTLGCYVIQYMSYYSFWIFSAFRHHFSCFFSYSVFLSSSPRSRSPRRRSPVRRRSRSPGRRRHRSRSSSNSSR